jgi:hypothetical protein
MSAPSENSSKTSFDATMGDLFAAGLYGDPVQDNFASKTMPTANRASSASEFRRASPKRRLTIAAWCTAVFLISAVASPYILN